LLRVVRDASRPGRPPGERWLLRARSDWSLRHEREPPDAVARALLDVFFAETGVRAAPPVHLMAHLVQEAVTTRGLGEPCLAEPELALVVCGSSCLGTGLEAAFLSGAAAGGRVCGWPEVDLERADSPKKSSQLALL
jgi:predicted NAD/FAD-dependent oxidoreductase